MTVEINPIRGLIEAEVGRPHWESDLIVLTELWRPLIRILLDTIMQRDKQRPWNLCVYGNTLTGKTTFFKYAIPALKEYLAKNLPKRLETPYRDTENISKYGIVITRCLTNTTLKGFYKSILLELNWGYSKQDSIQELEMKVGNAVEKQGCLLIVIDEFNQLYNKGDNKRYEEVLKALRNIPNQTRRPIVVVGTKKVLTVLKEDPETNNRFKKIEFPRFINNELFQATVAVLDQNLLETTRIESDFARYKTVINKLFIKSQGKMGALVQLYEEAVRIALLNKAEKLIPSFLDEAITIFDENTLLNDRELLDMSLQSNDYKQKRKKGEKKAKSKRNGKKKKKEVR